MTFFKRRSNETLREEKREIYIFSYYTPPRLTFGPWENTGLTKTFATKHN